MINEIIKLITIILGLLLISTVIQRYFNFSMEVMMLTGILAFLIKKC